MRSLGPVGRYKNHRTGQKDRNDDRQYLGRAERLIRLGRPQIILRHRKR